MSRTMGVPVVRGPLAELAEAYAEWMRRRGYAPLTVKRSLRDLARLSRWLDQEGLTAVELTDRRVAMFLRAQAEAGYRTLSAPRRWRRPLAFLREAGAMPPPVVREPSGPVEEVVAGYRRYLVDERGLTAQTVTHYEMHARRFLTAAQQPGKLDVADLSGADVLAYVTRECPRLGGSQARQLVVAVRSLLRYLHVAGLIDESLRWVLPAMTDPRGLSLPKTVDSGVVELLLASCDLQRTIGRRDLAILLLLSRLGLRAGEIAGLELEDLDWRAGELTVRGKGGRTDRLPLPDDVGRAVAEYLRCPRPSTECRAVFLKAMAPIGPVSREVVGWVVRDACRRAGVTPVGPHRLRHTAATGMLRSGASLGEIGQVLRHRDIETTAIYAKIDHRALRRIARPWPGAVA